MNMSEEHEETAESKPPFWSSLPGILTASGGVIVAVTGLLTALYSNGVIGKKANTNSATTANTAVSLVTVPSPSPRVNTENDRYKALTGTWEVVEERPKQMGGAKVLWIFNAVVSGNVLTVKGKMKLVNGKEVGPQEKDIRAVFETKLVDSAGFGTFEKTDNGVATRYPASLRLDGDPPLFHGTIDLKGQLACSLMGTKL